jgi:hypothetical protein
MERSEEERGSRQGNMGSRRERRKGMGKRERGQKVYLEKG